MIKKGKVIAAYQKKIVDRESKKYKVVEHTIDGKKYKVAYKNTTIYVNEIGNNLAKNTKCDSAVCYYINGNNSKFSLRSIDTKTDVSEIAKKLGGGGHRNASAITRKGFYDTII